MAESKPINVHCLIVGSPAVGKTTFSKRLMNQPIESSYQMTSRITVHRKSYIDPNRESPIQVLYFDFPGKELYRVLIGEVLKKLNSKYVVVVGVFDVTNRSSLATLESLLTSLKPQQQPEMYGILVGNKIDLVDKRIISATESQQKAKIFKFRQFECSALNDISIQDFHQLMLDLIKTNLEKSAVLPKANWGERLLWRASRSPSVARSIPLLMCKRGGVVVC